MRPEFLRYLRWRPFDAGTEHGRSEERLRRAAWAAVANVGSKAASMVLMLASVNLTIAYLGPARFGVWMTVFSFASMLTFLDLGVGNALTNLVSRRSVDNNAASLQSAVSGGLAVLALLGLAAALVLLLLVDLLPWSRLIRSDSPGLVQEARSAGHVFALFFGLTLFTGGVQKVFLGLQQAFESHCASAAATLLTILAIVLAAQREAGVASLLAITMAGQAVAALPLLVMLVRRRQLVLTAARASVAAEAPGVLRTGGMFLALQIGTMIGWGTDTLIISATLGAAQVATFAVVQRLFQFASTPLAIANQPLWGAYADAHARADRAFIRRTVRRSIGITALAATAICAVLVLAHGPIVSTWTKGQVTVPLGFLMAYALWAVIEATAVAGAAYMNGCAIVKPQLVAVGVFCTIAIPLKILLAQEAGLAGVVCATILAYVVAVPLLYALFFRDEVTEPARLV